MTVIPLRQASEDPETLHQRELLKTVIVGHVDHGKSTLVGRLLHDTESLPEGKYEAIQAMCQRRGMPFEWAFLMDALQAERDQGVTIDTAQIWFSTAKRDYVLIDAPGHLEFLKNMVTGAAQADAALLVVDAAEGAKEQSRRHGYLLHLLGVKHVGVVVNKMDAVNHDQARFEKVRAEFHDYLHSIGVTPEAMLPLSAREGDNVLPGQPGQLSWWQGPSLVEALDNFPPSQPAENLALRMPVQAVYKFDHRRIIAGRIESGALAAGDRITFLPSGRSGRVKSIEGWAYGENTTFAEARAGQSVGFTLEDQIFVERGEIATHETEPPALVDSFQARVFWLGTRPLEKGQTYKIKLATAETTVVVDAIDTVIDPTTLNRTDAPDAIERNTAGEVRLRLKRPLAMDAFSENAATGRFVIIDAYDIAGGGLVAPEGLEEARRQARDRARHLTPVDLKVTREERARRYGHDGGVLWFTGLSGSGKSTLATALEKRLFDRGYSTYVLDGDNVRRGLNSDLGFSAEDRDENIRRVGEVAALFADAGVIVLTAFISPYESERAKARRAAGDGFREVYVKADLETCEARDPKGLYAKARAGEIADFTGVSAPYEEPGHADLILDTSLRSVQECVDILVSYVDEHFRS